MYYGCLLERSIVLGDASAHSIDMGANASLCERLLSLLLPGRATFDTNLEPEPAEAFVNSPLVISGRSSVARPG